MYGPTLRIISHGLYVVRPRDDPGTLHCQCAPCVLASSVLHGMRRNNHAVTSSLSTVTTRAPVTITCIVQPVAPHTCT